MREDRIIDLQDLLDRVSAMLEELDELRRSKDISEDDRRTINSAYWDLMSSGVSLTVAMQEQMKERLDA